MLDFIHSGSVHIEVGWAKLRLEPDSQAVEDEIWDPYCHTGVVSIFIESCQNLGGKSRDFPFKKDGTYMIDQG